MQISPHIIADATEADVAQWLETRIAAALARSDGPVAMALPGGSTPFPILRLLAESGLDFSRLLIVPTDDRLVEESHDASNTGRLRALLQPMGAQVVSLDGMAADAVPHFALVWLGMGADGHVASLFPNTDPQVDDPQPIRRLTPDPLPPEAPFDRVTLTIPALLDCDELLLVMKGAEKRAVLDSVLAGTADLPVARLLRVARQPVTCFV